MCESFFLEVLRFPGLADNGFPCLCRLQLCLYLDEVAISFYIKTPFYIHHTSGLFIYLVTVEDSLKNDFLG